MKDLPKVIVYLEKELENPTYPRREAMEFIIKDMKDDFVNYVYEIRSKEQEESNQESYEQHLAEKGLSTNNGENLDGYDEYCYDLFLSELADGEKSKYEKVVDAVKVNTFSV